MGETKSIGKTSAELQLKNCYNSDCFIDIQDR